jgi:L-ascorbate metabolism protein UlaG (beta-lactamase superfamily)
MKQLRHVLLSTSILCYIFFANIIVSNGEEVQIHYLGHSSFIIEFNDSINVLTDFGTSYCWNYDSPIFSIGDFIPLIQTYSHYHDDHYNADRIPNGVQYTLDETDSLVIGDLKIKPIRMCENNVDIESSTAFLFEYKDYKICHLGDAQAEIMNINSDEQKTLFLEKFPNKLDILLLTIEGVNQFIPEAEKLIDLLKPRSVVPMHYWSYTYKDEFLNLLEEKTNQGAANYQINRVCNCIKHFDINESENESIQIYSLDPYPYRNAPINNANIAMNKPIYCSSFVNSTYKSVCINDGFDETSWGSASNNEEWVMLDLQQIRIIDSVILKGKKYALSYEIYVSEDSINWTNTYANNSCWQATEKISLGAIACRYFKILLKESRFPNSNYYYYEIEVYTHESDSSTNMNNAIKIDTNIICFPIPAKDILYIELANIKNDILSLELCDSSGRIVRTVNSINYSKNHLIELEINELHSGMYYVNVNTKTDMYIQKVLILN